MQKSDYKDLCTQKRQLGTDFMYMPALRSFFEAIVVV